MNIIGVAALAVTAAVFMLTLRPKNSEIALLLGVGCSAAILLGLLSQIGAIAGTVESIVSLSGLNAGYIAILLKVVGICLVTEFAADTCRDAGSSALAANVTLTGKILVTVTALPLYADILNAVLSIITGE